MNNEKKKGRYQFMMIDAMAEFKKQKRPMQIMIGIDVACYVAAFLLSLVFFFGYKEVNFLLIILILFGVANLLNSAANIKSNKKRSIIGIIAAAILIVFAVFVLIVMMNAKA